MENQLTITPRIWRRALLTTLVCGAWLASPAPALAVDGVIEINQARALAGGVTPGDTAGFPVSLNDSGSYRLTSDLVPPPGIGVPGLTTVVRPAPKSAYIPLLPAITVVTPLRAGRCPKSLNG